ncbi:SusC/RagA family TonB-linked outer membrane protein [Flavicella sediminum]|uniref:SusC/RagA family TonB-linked outer membrane protein n=1 Tax=Flavicella sediminum TaxID=2585141 RepID=UPI001123DFA6|nr:TonB-dependent receptor [Flavicella sediminum]
MKNKLINSYFLWGKSILRDIMRAFIFLFCATFFAFNSHNIVSQNSKVLINKDKSLTVDEVFQIIKKQTDYNFFYEKNLFKDFSKVKVKKGLINTNDLLNKSLSQGNFIITVTNNNGVLIKEKALENIKESNQQQQVSGLITDANGEPLPGASVLEKNTTNGVQSDFDGKFSLTISNKNAVLVISYLGFVTKEIEVGSQTNINVALVENAASLDEIVVIGYGTAKKSDLTGAIASVDVEGASLQPNANASQMLRGTKAGVQVRDNGRPGQSGNIVIRGTNSISASNYPLIVLDGIIYSGGLSDINPGDIESISILKDASSTAIYGSLAANGVIEVTTKKGKTQKPKVTFNTYAGFSDFANIPTYLNAKQYLAARLDGEIADGSTLPFQPVEEANIAAGRTINPFDEIKQSAPISNYEVSVSGREDKVSYFFSGAYSNVKSPVKGDNFKRISSRLNLTVNATDWLKFGINSGYTSRDDSGVRADLQAATYLSPYGSLYLEDGVSPKQQPMDIGLVANPIFDHDLDDRLSINNTLFANTFVEANILKGLSYKLNVGYTRSDSKLFTYSPSYEPVGRLGSGYKRHTERQNITLENIINYKKTFKDVHNLGLTLLYGIYEIRDQGSSFSSSNIFNDVLSYNALELGENYQINSDAAENKQNSSMARLSYNYSSKYFIDLSIRRDGYSAFGEGNKFGNFPALGFSWNISDEEFLSNSDFIDFLKLRTSWGKNGNRGVREYSSLSSIATTNYVFGDGSSSYVGSYATSFANPSLGWETTESLNLGVDAKFFNNRISASLNYYVSKTTDLLLNQTIPNTNGFEIFLTNIGETENKGFELDLQTTNIKTDNFSWDTGIAFSFNRNKIVKLSGRDLNEDGIEDDDIASGWFIGEPLGSNFDYVFDGIYQEGDDFTLNPSGQPGDIRFKDIGGGANGEPDGVIDSNDRKVLGSSQPDFIMGLTNVFRYKGFSLSSTFYTSQGGKSPNATLNPGTNFYDQANFLNVPYWTPDNPINTAARINYKNPLGYGFYQDRSFVRLQDVSLSYDFSSEILEKIGFSRLQIYASGKNLVTWTDWKGWDPEFGSGLRNPGSNGPLLKTYTFGINVSL